MTFRISTEIVVSYYTMKIPISVFFPKDSLYVIGAFLTICSIAFFEKEKKKKRNASQRNRVGKSLRQAAVDLYP